MGADVPKQFLDLGGKPVLQRSIEAFTSVIPGVKVITVLPQNHIDTWKQLCLSGNFSCTQVLVKGGITRFHSVKNALTKIPDGALVMIHDGVRPLVSADLLKKIIAASENAPAVIPVTPVTDTLKSLDRSADGILSTRDCADPDRSFLYGAQTPQTFWSESIKAAYSLGYDTSFTDDASVARKYGIPLSYVDGERYNIKITTPEDLQVAGKILL